MAVFLKLSTPEALYLLNLLGYTKDRPGRRIHARLNSVLVAASDVAYLKRKKKCQEAAGSTVPSHQRSDCGGWREAGNIHYLEEVYQAVRRQAAGTPPLHSRK